jgi:hypothetical protein
MTARKEAELYKKNNSRVMEPVPIILYNDKKLSL